MNKLWTLLFLLCFSAQAETDVIISLQDTRTSAAPYAYRSVTVQPLGVPTANSTSVILGQRLLLTTDGNGSITISNQFGPMLYQVTVQSPPSQAAFKYIVQSTNLGTIYAANNTVSADSATYPAGAVAWSISASDARYVITNNQGVVYGTVTNALGYVPMFTNQNLFFWSLYPTNAFATASAGFATNANFATNSGFATNALNATNYVGPIKYATNGSGIAGNGSALTNVPFATNASHLLAGDRTTNLTVVNISSPGTANFSEQYGNGSDASGTNSVAVGNMAQSIANSAMAIGFSVVADGPQSIAIGSSAQSDGLGAVALGTQAFTPNNGSIAIGNVAQVTATNSIAIGQSSSATHGNSMAVGHSASTTAPNRATFGSSAIPMGIEVTGTIIGNGSGITNLTLVGNGTAITNINSGNLTNVIPNNLWPLAAGANITLSTNGGGTVTIASSGGGGSGNSILIQSGVGNLTTLTNPTFTGTANASTLQATTFIGNGNQITALNANNIYGSIYATNLPIGPGLYTTVTTNTHSYVIDTIPVWQQYLTNTGANATNFTAWGPTTLNGTSTVWTVSSTNFTGNGANITGLNAANIASGLVPTARLGTGSAGSGTVLSGANTWIANSGATAVAIVGGGGTNNSFTNMTTYGITQLSGGIVCGSSFNTGAPWGMDIEDIFPGGGSVFTNYVGTGQSAMIACQRCRESTNASSAMEVIIACDQSQNMTAGNEAPAQNVIIGGRLDLNTGSQSTAIGSSITITNDGCVVLADFAGNFGGLKNTTTNNQLGAFFTGGISLHDGGSGTKINGFNIDVVTNWALVLTNGFTGQATLNSLQATGAFYGAFVGTLTNPGIVGPVTFSSSLTFTNTSLTNWNGRYFQTNLSTVTSFETTTNGMIRMQDQYGTIWLTATNGVLSIVQTNGGSFVETNGSLTLTGNIVAGGNLTATSNNITAGGQLVSGLGMPTNVAQYFHATSNTTNGFVVNTVYTNMAQRSILVGSAVLSTTPSATANITIYYTNGGLNCFLPIQSGGSAVTNDIIPFSVPLGSNATWSAVSTLGASAVGYITNVMNWGQ